MMNLFFEYHPDKNDTQKKKNHRLKGTIWNSLHHYGDPD